MPKMCKSYVASRFLNFYFYFLLSYDVYVYHERKMQTLQQRSLMKMIKMRVENLPLNMTEITLCLFVNT